MTSSGFFSIGPKTTKRLKTGRPATCVSCGLSQFVLSPRMEPFGNFKKGILNVGEAPGEEEDKKGRQWQGKVGRRLQQEYKRLGIDLFDDCLNINSINCRPTDKKGNNRPPTSDEIACCRKRVLDVIEQHKPKVIMLIGASAVESVIGSSWTGKIGSISKWRGWVIPDRKFNAYICPVFHPSYLERQQDSLEIQTIWRQDLKRGLDMVDQTFPAWKDEEKQVQIIDLADGFPSDMDYLKDFGMVAIDYETTGLKPYAEGHQIVCASIAYDHNRVVSFMLPEDRTLWVPLLKILRNKRVAKIAHNIKFEDTWTVERLGVTPKNWFWDTMLSTHLLDNRADITGLKFQVYVNYGVPDYNRDVDPYLKAKDQKNGNAFNRVLELVSTKKGREKLLVYCGMDSLFEYRLAKKHMTQVKGLDTLATYAGLSKKN